MRKYILYLLFLTIIICCSKKERKALRGYFYDKKEMKIYYFEKGEVQRYNIMDSTHVSLTFSSTQKNITLGEKTYEYNFNSINFISLLSIDESERIDLKKMNYSDFSLSDIENTTWEYIGLDEQRPSPKSFMRIDRKGNVNNFLKHENERSANVSNPNNYIGKFFNKFYCYSGFSPFLITGKDSVNLFILEIIDNKSLEDSKYLKVNSLNKSMLIGKWEKLPDSLTQNMINYNEYFDILDGNGKNYIKKRDSLRDLIDHANIEFASDGFFSRIIKRNNNVFEFKYEFQYDPNLNFVFIDDINYDNKYFKVKKLTKDTLELEISEPELLYTYIRVKDSI